METLHGLSFLKITAGQNRRQSRAQQRGLGSGLGAGGRPRPPLSESGVRGSQPGGRCAPGPAGRVGACRRAPRAHGCVLTGVWLKCGLRVPQGGSRLDHLTPT